MSKQENKETKNTEQKVITKYDRKVQRREAQKRQEKRDALKSRIWGIVVVVALAAVVASFPIRSYLAVNGTFIVVDGKKITRVEYDYNYNVAKTNYINTYGTYLYYMGMDISKDFDNQAYSDFRTWGDYFDELAVNNLKQYKALSKAAKEAGFKYDTTEVYKEYATALAENAKEAGMTEKAFIQSIYGELATEARVKPFIEESMYASAYYDKIYDEKVPTQEEVSEYYETNKDKFDSIDYYMVSVDAILPTEPTDKGLTSTESDDNTDATTDTTGTETDSSAESTAYEPTEEEVVAAMEVAKTAIDEKAKDIKANGNLNVDMKRVDVPYILRDWLFDAARKEGDSTVIEDASGNRYYAIEYVKRYLREIPAVDVRVVSTASGNADAILEEWKNGEATEESFAAICDKYSDSVLGANQGGLYEGMRTTSMSSEMREWLIDENRVAGDTVVIKPEDDEYNYVLYYVAPNRPEYILEIESTLAGEKMNEYVKNLVDALSVDDPKDNLAYPELIAAEEESFVDDTSSASKADESDTGSEESSEQ